MESALGAAAAGLLGRWSVEVAVLWISGVLQMRRQCLATTVHRPQSVCVWPDLVCHGALQGQMQPLQCIAVVVEPALGAAAGLGTRWYVGVAVLWMHHGLRGHVGRYRERTNQNHQFQRRGGGGNSGSFQEEVEYIY